MGKRKGNNKGKDSKRQRCHALIEPGQYGIFASCARFKEVAAAKEMRLLLKDAIDKYYPREENNNDENNFNKEISDENQSEKMKNTDIDIEDEIAKEILEMKKQDDRSKINKNNKDLLLREIPLGVESLTFFKLKQPIKPSNLVILLCKDLYQSGEKTGRFIQKLVPIDKSCNATKVEFEKLIDLALDCLIEENDNNIDKVKILFETYNVNLVKRNFDKISREEFMEIVKEKLDSKFGENWCRLQYKGSKTLINIYCFKNNIGISIIPNESFEKFCKFNIQQIFDKSYKDKQEKNDVKTDNRDDQDNDNDVKEDVRENPEKIKEQKNSGQNLTREKV